MARYIDADALKERLEDFSKWCRDGRKQGVDFVLDCPLPNMPTADVAPRAEWISVEERLPDVCGMPVLMVAKNEYGQANIVKGFTNYTCPIAFSTSEMEYYSVWHAWKVTHWMPLPEPPKANQ